MTTMQPTFTRRVRRALLGAAALASLAGGAAPLAAAPINFPPVPSFYAAPSPVAAGDLAVFNASASRDVDGAIVRYEWDLDNNGTYEVRSSSIRTASKRFFSVGTFGVKLRVTDNRGATAVTSRSLRVHAKPVALLTADRAVPTAGETVTYRATGSFDPDPDGFIRSYLWDLDGNGSFERSTGTVPVVATSFPVSGNQRIQVRVVDRFYAFTDRQLIVRVNRRPTAIVSATPNPAVVNQPVMLSGADSTDDRTIVRYDWDLNGDGTYETTTGATPTTTTMFPALGQARIGLQVTDDDGAVDQSVATITVNPAPVADTTPPRVTIAPPRVTMRHGAAAFRITCPATELSCDTKLVLKGRFGALKNRVLGSAREMIPGGETLVIRVPLSARTKAAVRRNGQVRATATAIAIDDAGNRGTVSKYVRITKR